MTVPYKQIPVYFDVFGQGKTLVLLHGFLESSSIWEEFVPILAQKNQVITIDLFGHGKTGKVGPVHTMEEIAEAIVLILDRLKIASATFIGHSMGGYVALAFAELFPERTNALLLLNSTPQADSQERKENRDRAVRIVRQNKDAFVRMSINHLFTSENQKIFQTEIGDLVSQAQNYPAESIVASIKGLKIRKDRTEILKKFKGRKIIIAGKKDPIVPYESIFKIAKFTESELISLPDGHMGFIENRGILSQKLLEIIGGDRG